MFIAALFTIAKIRKYPVTMLANGRKDIGCIGCVHVYIILLSHEKEGNLTICSNMDEM